MEGLMRMSSSSVWLALSVLTSLGGGGCSPASSALTLPPPSPNSFTLFESGQVRPLALSDDGALLYAVNTPDNRLEIYRMLPTRPVHAGSVTVRLEAGGV